MSGERYYTTKIWPQPSSTGSSNEDASFISTDPRGEPVTSTWKKSCREVETVPEFPELTCQNFRNPHLWKGRRKAHESALLTQLLFLPTQLPTLHCARSRCARPASWISHISVQC